MASPVKLVTAERVRELLSYDAGSGQLFWRVRKGRQAAGAAAGHVGPDGYSRVRIDGRMYMTHRVVWLHERGKWPAGEIDHANLCKSDNRMENLREASSRQNKANLAKYKSNTSGYKGVSWCVKLSKWRANVRIRGRQKHLGYFDKAEDAHNEYVKAAEAEHKEFARAE